MRRTGDSVDACGAVLGPIGRAIWASLCPDDGAAIGRAFVTCSRTNSRLESNKEEEKKTNGHARGASSARLPPGEKNGSNVIPRQARPGQGVFLGGGE